MLTQRSRGEPGCRTRAIAALERGEPAAGLSSKEQLAQRFAREITANRRVGDPLFDEAYATFGPQGVVDLLFLAGCYHTIALLLNTFAVPVPA